MDNLKQSIVNTPTGNIRRIYGELSPTASVSDNNTNLKPCTKNIVKTIVAGLHKVTAFIDPGSDRSLIRSSAAQSLGNMKPCIPVTLRGFGGGTTSSSTSLTLPINIDNFESTAELFIVADDLLPEDVLLGKNILCRPEVRLVIESGDCHIEPTSTSNLTDHAEKKFCELMREFKQCFANSIAELGQSNSYEMTINLNSDHPVNCQPYRIPFAKRDVVNRIVEELLQLQIIRRSTSTYASPVVLVKKKIGEDRLCIDYRRLNAITIKQPYPMPIVEEQLALLAGYKIFTTLDLVAGYYQIPIAESSRKFKGFVTNDGHYEFNRMPFGLVNAPSVFQEAINGIVSQLKPGEAIPYLDDIIIPSVDVEQGLERLRKFDHSGTIWTNPPNFEGPISG